MATQTPQVPSTKPVTVKDYWIRYFIVRDWKEFVDVNAWKLPKDAANWLERTKDNLVFWFANYFIVFVLICLLVGITMQQKSFAIVIIIILATASLLFLVFEQPIQVPNSQVKLEGIHKAGIFALVSLFSLWVTENFYTLLYCVLFVSMLVLAHASMRKRDILRPGQQFIDKAKYHLTKIGNDIEKLNKRD